jgi:DNA-directed RNA polymerase specialized sigma24 family protein
LKESAVWRRISVVMAGKSPYEVVLSEEQRRALERRAAAYSGPHRDVVRAKAILYAADGMSNAEIARRLDQSRQAVSEWRKRFCQEGVQGLEERPRPGRPRRFSGSPDVSVGRVNARFTVGAVGRGRRG